MSVPRSSRRQPAFDYDRTVVAFHGTRRAAARNLIRGDAFGVSENDDDWLGHGIYFWEFAPQQAWWWARRRYGVSAPLVCACSAHRATINEEAALMREIQV